MRDVEVEATEQHRELRAVEDDPIGSRGDGGHFESPLREPLVIENEAAAIPEQDLHTISPSTDEYE